MIVLVCYGLIIHLMSFIVLYVKYTVLKVKLEPLEQSPAAPKIPSSTSDSETITSAPVPHLFRVDALTPEEASNAAMETEVEV